jgi:urease accessory protein
MHTRLPLRSVTLLLATLAPMAAQAHPGHEAAHGLLAGLAHPLLGLDHLVAALAAGAWAAQRGGVARTLLPIAFTLALLAGVLAAGVVPLQASAVEQLIAASLLVFGAFVAFAWRVPPAACVVIAAAFALCHGLAHGGEQPAGAGALAYGVGLALTTSSVALLARAGAAALLRGAGPSLRWLGAACALGGIALLA